MFTFTNCGMRELLDTAIRENAEKTIAFLMNSLIADYIEGQDEQAGKLYNEYLTKVSRDIIYWIANTCVFERYANKLAKTYSFIEPYEEVEKYHWKYVGPEKDPRNIP